MRHLLVALIALSMAAPACAATKTEPDVCPGGHPVPIPHPPVKSRMASGGDSATPPMGDQARGVDPKGHDCARPHGTPGAKDTPIKAHTGDSPGVLKGDVSGTSGR
jgi:hypothetical protein